MTQALANPWWLLAAVLALVVLVLLVASVALLAGWTMGRKSMLPVAPAVPLFRRTLSAKDRAHPIHSDPWSAAQDRGEPEDPEEREDTL